MFPPELFATQASDTTGVKIEENKTNPDLWYGLHDPEPATSPELAQKDDVTYLHNY